MVKIIIYCILGIVLVELVEHIVKSRKQEQEDIKEFLDRWMENEDKYE